MTYEVEVNGRVVQVSVRRVDGSFVVAVAGHEWNVDAARIDAHMLSLLIDGTSQEVTIANDGAAGQFVIGVSGVSLEVTVNGRRRWGRKDESGGRSGPERLVAPMPGKIVRVLTTVGSTVQPRQPLVVVEAMKMENELRASRAGVVSELAVQEGQSVDAGALLLVVTPD